MTYKNTNDLPIEIRATFSADGQKRFKSVYNRESAKDQPETLAFLKAYTEAVKTETGKGIDLDQYAESDGIIEGLGIPYGGRLQWEQEDGSIQGRDFDGEYFDDKTDYTSDLYDGKALVKTMPVLYDHGMDDTLKSSVIGEVKSIEDTDKGKWFTIQLNRAHEYYKYLLYLAKCGALSLSTGAKNALKALDGHIDRWELQEVSLTPSACNPMAQIAIKSIQLIGDMSMTKNEELAVEVTDEVKEPLEDEKAEDAIAETEAVEKEAEEATEDAPVADAEKACDEKSEEENPEEEEKKKGADELLADLISAYRAVGEYLTSLPTAEKAEDDEETPELLADNAEHDVDEALEDDRNDEPEDAEHDEVDADEEIEKLRDEINEIKEELALEAEKKKAVETENIALKTKVEDCMKRLDAIELRMTSKPVLHPVANPKIGNVEQTRSNLEELANNKNFSPSTRYEISRAVASDEIADIMGLR